MRVTRGLLCHCVVLLARRRRARARFLVSKPFGGLATGGVSAAEARGLRPEGGEENHWQEKAQHIFIPRA